MAAVAGRSEYLVLIPTPLTYTYARAITTREQQKDSSELFTMARGQDSGGEAGYEVTTAITSAGVALLGNVVGAVAEGMAKTHG